MDTKLIKAPVSRPRRRHSTEFKAQIIEACLQPGVSIAAVALANQLNANFVRNWVREYREQRSQIATPRKRGNSRESEARCPAPALVPVTVETTSLAGGDIQIEVRRQQTVIKIAWPVAEAENCVRMLRALLQ
jgi:transposase-like protein